MNYTLTYDQWIAALALWREARGSSIQAMTGIYNVILNRTKDPHNRWPKTIPGVILQHAQFSSFSFSDPNVVKFPLPPVSGTATPSPDWTAWVNCVMAVTAPLGADPTSGATNYESCEPDKLPPWADKNKLTTTIGLFRFYRL